MKTSAHSDALSIHHHPRRKFWADAAASKTSADEERAEQDQTTGEKEVDMYTIKHETTGKILASNLNLDAVDAWWARHETTYFGLRTVGFTIFVTDAA